MKVTQHARFSVSYRTFLCEAVYSCLERNQPSVSFMDLIRRSLLNDEDAFAELFHQYKNLVYKTAFLMLGDSGEAEDSLQEIFLQVHKPLASYQAEKGAFTTWLHRITVNYCLNRRRKRRFLWLSLEQITQRLLPQATPTFEYQWGQEDAVRQALKCMSDKLRAVVVLRYYWELSYAEIAQILEIPLGTVKSRLDLALKTLRKDLEPSMVEYISREEVAE